jgi:hypothetical protein
VICKRDFLGSDGTGKKTDIEILRATQERIQLQMNDTAASIKHLENQERIFLKELDIRSQKKQLVCYHMMLLDDFSC